MCCCDWFCRAAHPIRCPLLSSGGPTPCRRAASVRQRSDASSLQMLMKLSEQHIQLKTLTDLLQAAALRLYSPHFIDNRNTQ